MKKLLITIGIGAALLAAGLFVLRNVNVNQIGADQYYTKIIGQATELEDKGPDGTIYTRYEYELLAHDSDGNKEVLTFTANKPLREDAYLRLYVKDEKGVTSYEEVSVEDLPKSMK